ncbi:DUF4169 family protein [Lutimaribacter sp. EGI FJ00015]|uniref:DUF4169 family protein n=1 Tax=Lutimaribacter degradans TaxID=2945989 RepID=A0ACC5ZSP0_9RHOB|nr:DUF4169 family protein [Lutimaribacter sp. EGI FJ00013]MCM2561338.1 DUF4169 family protein [Lutimaribacter sp. EGI FJ00013]MCO0611711.1 DUF4169 family protein [Lutimaribacter sp. EGI FJ00015]MCO0635167.1 DUF4169 family protein [Lutimaribacter sp. EGI FJ00014]
MKQVVNLNKARKARDKSRKKALADENAVKYGRSKAAKQRDTAQSARDAQRLDAHKRDE